eukprot:UN24127
MQLMRNYKEQWNVEVFHREDVDCGAHFFAHDELNFSVRGEHTRVCTEQRIGRIVYGKLQITIKTSTG